MWRILQLIYVQCMFLNLELSVVVETKKHNLPLKLYNRQNLKETREQKGDLLGKTFFASGKNGEG